MAKFNTGQSFADGDTVTGAKLNNITGLLDIYSGVIADQTSIAATVSTADLLLIADTDAGSSGAANKVTVQKLLNDALTGGTFTNANLSGNLTVSNLSTTLAGDLTISSGTATLSTSGVSSGTYGTTNAAPRIVIDSKGRITSATQFNTDYAIRTELSSTTSGSSGSELIGFRSSGTGSTGRTIQSKFSDVVSVKDFGATGNGSTDDTSAIQAAWDSIKSSNGTLFFPMGTYKCNSSLNFTVSYSSNNHFHSIVGDCATIDFSGTSLTSGNMIVFGSGVGLFEEKSRFAMEGLSLIGPTLGTITTTSTPPHSLVGIFFNYAMNLSISNVTVFNFYIGYKVDYCFPIIANSVLSDNCYVGLQLVGDVTCSSWVGCSFKEGRFGVVIQPKASNKAVYGQTFVRPLLEGNDVGMVLDPLDGSGIGIWDIDVIDPYMESITLDGFRIGRSIDYNDASVTGSDRSRNAFNTRITGGVWDGTWGTAGHQPVLFHLADSAGAPAGCIVDIPVQLSTMSIGFTRKSQFNNRMDVSIGASTSITNEASGSIKVGTGNEYQFDSTLKIGGFSTGTSGNLRFYTSSTERIRVDGSGNCSIGTATALSKLHVHGDLTMSNATTAVTASTSTITPPATVAGYLTVSINGTSRKIPYYAT